MIGLAAKFLLSPIGRVVAGAFGVLALAGVLYGKGWVDRGRHDAALALRAEIQERDRQAAANRQAKDDEAVTVAELLDRTRDLEQRNKELTDAANSDPDAGACGLSLDGVRRHNRLIGTPANRARPAR